MKNYSEFCEYVRNHIREYFPEEYRDADISLKEVYKNNYVQAIGIVVEKEGEEIYPILYLEDYYHEYVKGESENEVCRKAAKDYFEIANEKNLSEADFENFELCRNKIFPAYINSDRNRFEIRDLVNRKIGDMALIYRIELKKNDETSMGLKVGRKLLEKWNLTEKELNSIAIENMRREKPAALLRVEDVLSGCSINYFNHEKEYLESGKENYLCPEMMVMNCENFYFGAAVMNDPKVLERTGELMNGDYYIIPSSVHELTIFPEITYEGEKVSPFELRKIFREINKTNVEREDFLSKHVYKYSCESRSIEQIKEAKNRRKDYER